MIDINTILTQALTAAVAEATAPLQQRIAALEAQLAAQATPAPQDEATTLNAWEMALQNRVVSVEAVASRLHERIAALEKHTAVLDQHGGILEYLDNQEWFWEKVSRYIINNSDITVDELHNIKERLEKITTASDARIQELVEEALDAHLENANHPDDDDIETAIDSAIENHEENRTHGDKDDIAELVQKLLNSASISISV